MRLRTLRVTNSLNMLRYGNMVWWSSVVSGGSVESSFTGYTEGGLPETD